MVQILIIDDDTTIQTLLARSLTPSGYEVSIASNGAEGLRKAKQLQPALIICDWLMPELNGIEVCRQVKAIPELATTFFILLTSLASVENRVQGLDAGADDFLCKPIEMNELKARVRAGLRLHELSRDLKEQKYLLEMELAEAAEYVCSILPEPLATSFLNIDVRFIPSRRLGGDSFDFYWLDANHLLIYLLDVSGHGLRAALPSLSILNLLRSRGLEQVNYYRPNEVLSRLNHNFQMTQRNDKYFTIWYGIYNHKQRRLTYSCAGHPPAILLAAGTQDKVSEQYLKTPGFPVGMFSDAEYINADCLIHSPASLYLFSDGIYEIERPDGKILGLLEFINLVRDCFQQSKPDLDWLLEIIKTEVNNNQFQDDLSIIKIDFH